MKPKSISIEVMEADGYHITEAGILYRKFMEVAGTVNKSGYRVVRLVGSMSGQYMMHRLVAAKYLEPIEGKPYVNHKDKNKLNNNVANLEWVDVEENTHHAFDILAGAKDKAVALKLLGFKNLQIANTLGVHEATVYKWLVSCSRQ